MEKEKVDKKKSTKPLFVRFLIYVLIFLKDLILGLVISLVGLVFVLTIFVYITYLNYANDFKKVKAKNNSTQNIIYDRGGNKIYESFGAKEPDRVKISETPDLIIKATLASEDINFFNHGAIDPKGLARAAYLNLKNSDKTGFGKLNDLFKEESYTQGGSTITQQLVKNLYLTNERSFDRKIKEIVYAFEVEKTKSKEQILEDYLNNVYYGEQSLGIKNAAKRFFDKNIDELKLSEVSMLVGLPASPSSLSPISGDFNAAKMRQEYVLNQMIRAGYISVEEAKIAANESLYFSDEEFEPVVKHPFYVHFVKSQAEQIIGNDELEKGGYTIYSYLDPEKQLVAEKTTKSYIDKFKNRKVTNSAAVVLDNKESEIVAMVGGVDYEKSKVNVATSKRQPGSSFKPIVYLTGLLEGYSAATRLVDISVNFGGQPQYRPKNYDGGYRGNVTMRTALANSLNIPAVEMAKLVGVSDVISTAKKLGIESIDKNEENYGLSIALGSAEVTPLELATAYSVFANNGKLANFSAIEKIEDSKGNIIYQHQKIKKEAVDERAAFIIGNILSDNRARSLVFGANSPLTLKERKVAAKTGTTDDFADSWTMGFTPQYTVGVWMGNNDRSKMARVSGVEGAAYIWHDIIAEIHKDLPAEDFEKPEDLSELWINPYTGMKSKTSAKPNILEYFIPGTEPKDKPDYSYLNQFYKK